MQGFLGKCFTFLRAIHFTTTLSFPGLASLHRMNSLIAVHSEGLTFLHPSSGRWLFPSCSQPASSILDLQGPHALSPYTPELQLRG